MRFKKGPLENQMIRKAHLKLKKAMKYFLQTYSFYEHALKVKYEEFDILKSGWKEYSKIHNLVNSSVVLWIRG